MTATPLETLRRSMGDRYRVERELGAGGMATVYLAEDLKHRRKVAIKLLKPDLTASLSPEQAAGEHDLDGRSDLYAWADPAAFARPMSAAR